MITYSEMTNPELKTIDRKEPEMVINDKKQQKTNGKSQPRDDN